MPQKQHAGFTLSEGYEEEELFLQAQIGLLNMGIGDQLLRAALHGDGAIFQNVGALAQLQRLLDVLLHQQDGGALLGDGLDQIQNGGDQQQWVAISKDYIGNDPLNRPATTIHCIPAGDLNGNGTRAEATDVQCLYTYLTSGVIDGALAQREGIFRAVADLNGDGSVDVYDLQRLYETASGLDQVA